MRKVGSEEDGLLQLKKPSEVDVIPLPHFFFLILKNLRNPNYESAEKSPKGAADLNPLL